MPNEKKEKISEELRAKASEVAKRLNEAFKGAGTDEATVINQITSCNNIERQIVKKMYMTFYGKTLEEDISSELSGNFEKCALSLLMPSNDFEAKCLHSAMKGLGTDEHLMIQIICTKDAEEIVQLQEAYSRLFNGNLDKTIKGEQGGYLGRILRSIAAGGRACNHGYDMDSVKKEAEALYRAGEGKLGTDEDEFIRVLCSKSFPELTAIFAVYKDISKHDFEYALRREMSGNLLLACVTIYRCVTNRPLYFAKLLNDTVEGLGTDDSDLIRLLVSRSEIDLPQIKSEFAKYYNTALYLKVRNDTSGNYKKLLLAIIGI